MRKIITLEPDTATCASLQKLFDSYKKSTITEEEAGPESSDYKTLQGKLCVVSTVWPYSSSAGQKSGELYQKIIDYLEKSQWVNVGGGDLGGLTGGASSNYYEKGNDQIFAFTSTEASESEEKKFDECRDIQNEDTPDAIEYCLRYVHPTYTVTVSSGKAVNVEEVYDPMPLKRLNDSRPRQ